MSELKFPLSIDTVYRTQGVIIHVGLREYKTRRGFFEGRMKMLHARFPDATRHEVRLRDGEWQELVDDVIVARFVDSQMLMRGSFWTQVQ